MFDAQAQAIDQNAAVELFKKTYKPSESELLRVWQAVEQRYKALSTSEPEQSKEKAKSKLSHAAQAFLDCLTIGEAGVGVRCE